MGQAHLKSFLCRRPPSQPIMQVQSRQTRAEAQLLEILNPHGAGEEAGFQLRPCSRLLQV